MMKNKLRSRCVCVRKPLTLSVFFVLLLVVPHSEAQQSTATRENRRNEFGIWGAISFDATTWIGATPDARFGNIGLRYGRVLAANDNLAFSWTIDAIPVAVLSVDRFTVVPTGSGSFTVQRRRDHTYGAGLSPIGLKLNFNGRKPFNRSQAAQVGFFISARTCQYQPPNASTLLSTLAAESRSSDTRAARLPSVTSTSISPMAIAR